MEIVLQGRSTYGQEWDGIVEVESLRLFQIKRLVGSRSVVALFRKFLKIMSKEGSPVRLPEWLSPADLDIGDFMQLVVGVTAMSKGRQVQKTYVCPHCGADQPRVVDIVSVFVPGVPRLPGGSTTVQAGDLKIICRNVRIRDFLEVHAEAEKVAQESWKEGPGPSGKPKLDLAYIRQAYGDAFPFSDEEDVEDFMDQVVEVGMVAARVERLVVDGTPVKDDFRKRLAWLFNLQGDALEAYGRLSGAVADLSATLASDYASVCAECKKDFKASVGVEDYFFDSRWTSSSRWSTT